MILNPILSKIEKSLDTEKSRDEMSHFLYFAGQFNAILDFVAVVEKLRSVELFLVFHLLFAVGGMFCCLDFLFAGGGSFCCLFVLTFCSCCRWWEFLLFVYFEFLLLAGNLLVCLTVVCRWWEPARSALATH